MAFKCPFVAIFNVRIKLIQGYNIENAQDWKIYNKGRFKAIAKTNNFKQRPIFIHIEHMVTHSNDREHTGAHGKDV